MGGVRNLWVHVHRHSHVLRISPSRLLLLLLLSDVITPLTMEERERWVKGGC